MIAARLVKDEQQIIGKTTRHKIIQSGNWDHQTESADQYRFAVISFPSDQKIFTQIRHQLNPNDVLLLNLNFGNSVHDARKFISELMGLNIQNPVVVRTSYNNKDYDQFIINASSDFGSLLTDGLIDGIWIENEFHSNETVNISYRILQACGARISSTEFIACPSCGRTKFDIQKAFEEVKLATNHLCGLKIAVMGCVVNGPGEMADADYGYIGAGNGKVNLYKSRTLMKQGVDEKDAVSQLILLIKEFGDWKDDEVQKLAQ